MTNSFSMQAVSCMLGWSLSHTIQSSLECFDQYCRDNIRLTREYLIYHPASVGPCTTLYQCGLMLDHHLRRWLNNKTNIGYSRGATALLINRASGKGLIVDSTSTNGAKSILFTFSHFSRPKKGVNLFFFKK